MRIRRTDESRLSLHALIADKYLSVDLADNGNS